MLYYYSNVFLQQQYDISKCSHTYTEFISGAGPGSKGYNPKDQENYESDTKRKLEEPNGE